MLEVMRDIWQSRYLRSNVAHKQLARTSLSQSSTKFYPGNLSKSYTTALTSRTKMVTSRKGFMYKIAV